VAPRVQRRRDVGAGLEWLAVAYPPTMAPRPGDLVSSDLGQLSGSSGLCSDRARRTRTT
jgi:hypothetical protein